MLTKKISSRGYGKKTDDIDRLDREKVLKALVHIA